MNFKKIITNAGILTLLIFILIEALIRIFFSENMSGRFEYGYHPTAGFVEKNDGTVELVRAGGRRFRPQEFKMPKPAGTYRVFVVGDSVPRGPSLEGAYAWQLQELLKSQGTPAEVLNLGVAGYGVRRNQLVLKQALTYQPNLIILHLNDSNEYEDEREWRRAEDFKSWHPSHWLLKSQLIARLYELKTEKVFWYWLPQSVREQEGIQDVDAEVAAATDAGTKELWLNRFQTTSKESVKLTKEAGIELLVVVPASKVRAGLDAMQLDTLPSIKSLGLSLEEKDQDVLWVQSAFEKEADPKILFSDSSHLTRLGHKILANALVSKIKIYLSK